MLNGPLANGAAATRATWMGKPGGRNERERMSQNFLSSEFRFDPVFFLSAADFEKKASSRAEVFELSETIFTGG